MRHNKTRALLVLAAVAALVLSACGSTGNNASGSNKKTVALAFVGPLTGTSASSGINIRNAAKLAIKQANDVGGNVTIELKEYDTQGDPAQAVTVKDQYINESGVIGVIGPTFSGETKAVLPDLQQNGLVMISPSATNVMLPSLIPNETVFHRVIPDDDAQGKAVTGYIVKKLTAHKVAYVHDNSDYGKGLAEGTRKTVEAAGVSTALEDAIDPAAQDYSAVVNKVKSAAPDVIFYGGYYSQAGRFRKQLVDAGVTATFVTGDGSLDPGFITAGGANAEGAQITCPCNLATPDMPGKLGDFAKAYTALTGAQPGTYSTEGYDAANILISGIKQGNTTRQKLLDFVNHLGPYDGISKTIQFEPNGNVKADSVFFFEVKSGKLTLLGDSDTLLK